MPSLPKLGLAHHVSVDIGVLQFTPRIEGQLRGHGLDTIGSLDSGSAAFRNIPFHLDAAVADKLQAVSENTDEVCTSWSKVWLKTDKSPYNFAYAIGPADLCPSCRSKTLLLLRHEYGLLLNIPLREGYKDLGQLVDTLAFSPDLPSGFGKKKMISLAEMIETELRTCFELHGHIAGSNDERKDDGNREKNARSEYAENLRAALGNVSIGALGLGAKTKSLTDKGWHNVGGLPKKLETSIFQIPSLGRRTAERALEAMGNLAAAYQDGEVSRERFAMLEGIPVVPKKRKEAGESLPDYFRKTLLEAADHDNNPVTKIIVAERICKAGSDTATLEDIGSQKDVNVTRERVRQIEMRFLRRVRTALLDPWDRRAGCYFSDEFNKPFVELADAVAEADEVGIDLLASEIEIAWDCSRRDANLLVPMVAAIIEGSARTTGELRRLGDLPDELLRPLRRPARDWPAWNLATGKSMTTRTRESGITTAEELRKAWLDGFDFGNHADALLAGLQHLANYKSGHSVDALDLADAMQCEVLPKHSNEPESFIQNLGEDLCDLVRQGEFFTRAEDVIRRRSLVPPSERETTQVLADDYGVSQPTVSRTQTVTLERLNALLLMKTAGVSGAILRPSWLAFWKKVENIYERFENDQKTFQRSLAQVLKLDEQDIGLAVHPIWAILSGRTTKASFGYVRTGATKTSEHIAPIILTGFRRYH